MQIGSDFSSISFSGGFLRALILCIGTMAIISQMEGKGTQHRAVGGRKVSVRVHVHSNERFAFTL